MFLSLLLFENPILLEEAPSYPQQRQQRQDGDRGNQSDEASRRKHLISVAAECAAFVPDLCRLCEGCPAGRLNA
jgi:hypothetical protein